MNSASESISAERLRACLEEERGVTLIDVLPAEYYRAEHLPTAQNACVYQVDFVDAVKAIAPALDRKVVVYGSGTKRHASEVAASKLRAAGWGDVWDFSGGIQEWRQAGYPLEGTGVKREAPRAGSKIYRVNTDQSLIQWTGRNRGGTHTGTLKLASGEITVREETPISGYFVIAIKSLTNTDIEDRSLAGHLIQHLLSTDFFEADTYPEGKFVISRLDPISDATPGRPNYEVKGTLILKGIERQIAFPAQIWMQENRPEETLPALVAQADFDIDRTEWNILYGSGRFFDCLGMHLVNDLVSIHLHIVVE